MSIEVVVRAAERLRSVATNPAVPSMRWYVDDDGMDFNVLAGDPIRHGGPFDVARGVPPGVSADESPIGEYLVAMQPSVALALADWLEFAAAGWNSSPVQRRPAVAVALCVLGEPVPAWDDAKEGAF